MKVRIAVRSGGPLRADEVREDCHMVLAAPPQVGQELPWLNFGPKHVVESVEQDGEYWIAETEEIE